MEAVAALSLACNILQVTQTSIDLAKLFREVHKKGSTTSNDYHKAHSAQLKASVDTLETSIISCHAGSHQQLDKNDVQLLEIARESANLANQLQKNIALIPQSNRKRDVLKIFSKTLINQNNIDEISERLAVVQRDLDTRILVNLSLKVDATRINTQAVASLGPELKDFIHNLALKQRQALQNIFVSEQIQTRNAIESNTASVVANVAAGRKEANQQVNTDLRKEQLSRLLTSLTYPEMNARLNQISVPHSNTFEWIFEARLCSDMTCSNLPSTYPDSGSNQGDAELAVASKVPASHLRDTSRVKWDDLPDWFTTSSGVYWINGKVGSGKSTFMKFLANNARSKTALEQWAGQRPLAIVQHYFWSSGTALQRSSKAFFLCVLRQILEQHSLIVHDNILTSPSWAHKRVPHDWSQSELIQLIDEIQKGIDLCICFFVDGLDENETSQQVHDQTIVEYLMAASTQPNTKCCVASRPLKLYQQQFKDCPGLRLQDLTHRDMAKLILDSLLKFNRSRTQALTSTELNSLQNQIAWKANGVFIWVSLALSSLERGFLNDDSLAILSQRLDQLPPRLQELYEHMWRQLNGDEELYREEAATLFRLVLHRDKFWSALALASTLLCLTFAANDNFRKDLLESFGSHDLSKSISRCRSMVSHIQTRCAGIIEIVGTDQNDSCDLCDTTGNGLTWLGSEVQFVHRSAYAFLCETVFGASILNHCPYSEADLAVKMAKTLLPGMLEALHPDEDFFKRREESVRSSLNTATKLLHPVSGLALTSIGRHKLYRSIVGGLKLYKDSTEFLHNRLDPICILYRKTSPQDRRYTVSLDGYIGNLRSKTAFVDSMLRSSEHVNPEFADYMLLCSMNLQAGGFGYDPPRYEETLGALRLLFELKPNVNRNYFLRYVFPFKKSAALLMLETSADFLCPPPAVWHDLSVCMASDFWQLFMQEAMRYHLDLSEKFVVAWYPGHSYGLFSPIEAIVGKPWHRSGPVVILEVNLCFLVRSVYTTCTRNLAFSKMDSALVDFTKGSDVLPQCGILMLADESNWSQRDEEPNDERTLVNVSEAPWRCPTHDDAASMVNYYQTTYMEQFLLSNSKVPGGYPVDGEVDKFRNKDPLEEYELTILYRQCFDRGQHVQIFDVLEAKGYFKKFDDPDVMHVAPAQWLEDDVQME